MKTITICVSPLVKCIFEARYGREKPIQIHRSDVVYHLLQGDPIRVNPNKNKLLQKTLTRTLTLKVSPALYRRIKYKNRQIHVGLFLHKIYQQEMLTFVEAQHLAGVPAQSALKNYLLRHSISEDDYAMETAYTAWKRRQTFFKEFYGGKFVGSHHRIEPPLFTPQNIPEIPSDPSDILHATTDYYNNNVESLSVSNRKILAYLLSTACQMTGNEISKVIPSHPRSIQRYVADIRFQYGRYSDVTRDVDTIIRTLRTN